jgi:hypothetical protein
MEVRIVRIEAYLRILSDEATVRSIHTEANLPNASIKRLKARRGASDEELCWNWQTARTPIDADNPDDGLRALLQTHRPMFPIIKKHQGPETDIYLEVVTQYEEGEEPRGLYLSAETVQLLSEMGGSLDNDVVVTVAGRSHNAGRG